MSKFFRTSSKGFTLVELLIVIAIIGLLAGGILVSLSYAQKHGRDAQRVADINSVATALSAYYADNHGYPPEINNIYPTNYNNLGSYLVTKYMTTLPTPVNLNYYYSYRSCLPTPPATVCPNYALGSGLETSSSATYTNGNIYQYNLKNGERVNKDFGDTL